MWLLEWVISLRRIAFPFASVAFVALGALAAANAGCSGSSATSTSGTGDGSDSGQVGSDGGVGVDGSTPGTDGGVTKDGGGTVSDAAAGNLPPMTSAIKIIVEPTDRAAALISAIQSATKSVHMTMYLLSNSSVISALIAQKNAGHEVKVPMGFPPD